MNPADIMKVIQAVQVLNDLTNIPMIGMRVEAARDALTGGAGLTAGQVYRLHRWAVRWGSLSVDVKRVYETVSYEMTSPASLDIRAAERCLWRILEGHDAPGWAIGRMLERYHDIFGRRPASSVAPQGPFIPRAPNS